MSYHSRQSCDLAIEKLEDDSIKRELNMWLRRYLLVREAVSTIETFSQCLDPVQAMRLYNTVESIAFDQI